MDTNRIGLTRFQSGSELMYTTNMVFPKSDQNPATQEVCRVSRLVGASTGGW